MHHSIKTILKVMVFLILIIFTLLSFPFIIRYYENINILLAGYGSWAPIIYILLLILAVIIAPLPASPLAIAAGAFFGPWHGMLYTLIGATLGAVCVFLATRFFLSDFTREKLRKHSWYKKVEHESPKRLAYLVFLTRLMPQLSFDLISALAALTPITLTGFVLATFFGMIPIVTLLSFFGSALSPYLNSLFVILTILFIAYLFLIYKKSQEPSVKR